MNIPAATKIDSDLQRRFEKCHSVTRLRMADLLRVGLNKVLREFEITGGILLSGGDSKITPTRKSGVTTKKKARAAR